MKSLRYYILAIATIVVLTAGTALAGKAFLGITMDSLSPSMARALQLEKGQGVLVNEIVTDSPAEAAGLEVGDVILAINGRDIEGTSGLAKVMSKHEPDDEVTVTVLREGKSIDLPVTLSERKNKRVTITTSDDGENSWSWIESDEDDTGRKVLRFSDGDKDHEIVIGGLDFSHLNRGFLGVVPGSMDRDELREMGIPNGRGVYIEKAVEDGPAAAAGLEDGDVIVALDDEVITDGDDLHDFLADTDPEEEVTVHVMRDGREREFEVVLGESSSIFPKNIQAFMPSDPHDPSKPRFYEFHRDAFAPHAEMELQELEELARDREELSDLKDELRALKDELRELRDELRDRR